MAREKPGGGGFHPPPRAEIGLKDQTLLFNRSTNLCGHCPTEQCLEMQENHLFPGHKHSGLYVTSQCDCVSPHLEFCEK